MAEDGERATKIAPVRMEIAIRLATGSPCIKGIKSASIKTVKLPKVKVLMTSPMVTNLILLNRLLSSFKYSSLPAAKAINANESSATKRSLSVVSTEIRPNTKGPVAIPVNKEAANQGEFDSGEELSNLF